MVVSTRIVLSLLGVLGAIQAGLSLTLEDRYPASYAYPAFAVVVFLVFAVGWMVGGLVGKGLVRGFKRVERAVQSRRSCICSRTSPIGRRRCRTSRKA